MNLLENLDQIILNLNLLIKDVWKLVLFETSIQDNSLLIIIWSMVVYFVVLFISVYVLKIIIEGIFKFIFNPITFIFIIFIFGLSSCESILILAQLSHFESILSLCTRNCS